MYGSEPGRGPRPAMTEVAGECGGLPARRPCPQAGLALPQMPSSPTAMGRTTRELANALGVARPSFGPVQVDYERVATIAEHIRQRPDFEAHEPARWDNEHFWLVDGPFKARSQFFAIGNAINFRFWSLTEAGVSPAVGTLDGERLRGSMYMWRALRRTLERGEVQLLDANFLATLSHDDFDRIFADDSGTNPLSVAVDERIANLRDLGLRLAASWDGQFLNVARASEGSLVAFSRSSKAFRAFDDPVQKLTMVNAIVHSGSGVFEFLDQPLPAIDYHLLKHALRQGLVRVTGELDQKLRAGELLTSGEGQGLRMVALAAFVQLAERAAISGEIIDNKYWLNRSNCADQMPVCVDRATADRCPFLDACQRLTTYGLPLELTRYY